jgi:exonuclease SbcC
VILNTITLHNFMSYGDASLDLSSFNVACLSGLNGAGKSAVLDAVTWAIWESGRSTSDEMIRAGQQEMWVDLTFELEGNLYRVRRSRQRNFPRGGAKTVSKGTLEFQVCATGANGNGNGKHSANGNGNGKSDGTAEDHGWHSLTAASTRETQTRICDVLRMDYDTFVNSVYLRQGRADEFTTRPPAERKQVLSEILGLSYFDRLQELSREQARQRKAQAEVIESNLADRDDIAAQLTATRDDWQSAMSKLEHQRAHRTTQAASVQNLQRQISELSNLQLQLEPSRQRLAEIAEEVTSMEATRARLIDRQNAIEALLATVDDAENAAMRFRELRRRVEQLDEISLSRVELDTRRLELKSSLAATRGRMEVELEHLQLQLESQTAARQKLETQLAGRDKLDADHAKYKQLVQQEAEMAQRQETFMQLSARAEQLHTAIVELRFYLEAQLGQKQQQLGELKTLIEGRATLQTEAAQLESDQQRLDAAEVEFEHVEQQGLKVKQEIDAIDSGIAQFRKQQVDNNHKCKELKDAKSLSMCPLCAAPIVDRSAVLARYEKSHQEIDAEISELETKKLAFDQKRADLRQRYSELKRKLNERKALDVRIGEFNARKAALQRADETHQKLESELAELQSKLESQNYAEVERESLISIKAELHKLDFDPVIYSSLQAQIRALRHVEVRHQQLRRDETDVTNLNAQIPITTTKIQTLQKSLSEEDYAPNERTQIRQLDEQLAEFPYDRAEHQRLKQELAKLLPLVDKLKDVDQAIGEKPELAKELAALTDKITSRHAQSTELQQSIAAWSARISNIPEMQQRCQDAEQHLEDADKTLQQIERESILLESQLQQLEQQLATFEKKQSQLTALIAETNDYMLLAEAFGKKGIQAVIIENAVPEIESEANRILSRLSENQMHVALITQQRTKQGNVTETLEIVIADQVGTRAYELYSGGEAFKINFAIRLALSRLLARRAGAKLQSLIIDEGFGSQDEASRGRLVNAINAIRSDFARILIVTHIAEIKDLFPVQIQVQKDNGVSSINLMHAF